LQKSEMLLWYLCHKMGCLHVYPYGVHWHTGPNQQLDIRYFEFKRIELNGANKQE